ncbi:MAG: hypothetical protein FVQ79_08105 [Planctomycetes bacterium]|nr:hypothetical protein [Planctomycetota bacterium]
MRNFIIITIVLLCMICQMGCQEKSRTILAVKFENDSSIKYRMVSERNVETDLDGSAGKSKPTNISEKLELVMSYSPVGPVEVYGITTMKAVCESAKVTRRGLKGKPSADVADLLAGRSFNFTISPVGKVLDNSEMDALVLELGNKSIKTSDRQGRMKSPDMIADFIALQKHLWDSVTSVPQGTVGAVKGQTWKRLEYIPLPVPVRAAREITYTLADGGPGQVEAEGAERKVEIQSTFALSDEKLPDWPRLYERGFRMQGMFGFLRNYKFKSLEGSGVQVFNVDSGIVESDEQEYRLLITASFPAPLGDPPMLTIDQKLTIKLMAD